MHNTCSAAFTTKDCFIILIFFKKSKKNNHFLAF